MSIRLLCSRRVTGKFTACLTHLASRYRCVASQMWPLGRVHPVKKRVRRLE